MSKNKLRKFAEMELYSNVFQADFEQLRTVPFALRGRWRSEYFRNDNPIVVELGCGKGEYTVELARQCPDANFIGIDIKGARMYDGATKAIHDGLANAAFVRTRIEFVEAFFAAGEVDELWITFPDPQMHKPRKRLVGTMMLSRYRAFLRPGGIINLKTDSQFLSTYTRLLLQANGIQPLAMTEDLYAMPDIPPQLAIQTYYEAKWRAHGLAIKYIRFTLPPVGQLIEPEADIEYDTYRSAGRGVKEC